MFISYNPFCLQLCLTFISVSVFYVQPANKRIYEYKLNLTIIAELSIRSMDQSKIAECNECRMQCVEAYEDIFSDEDFDDKDSYLDDDDNQFYQERITCLKCGVSFNTLDAVMNHKQKCVVNAKDDDGNLKKCWSCGSFRHLRKDCPDDDFCEICGENLNVQAN